MEAFEEFIGGIRKGDAEAAARLVREYEPEIRRAVRVHLNDSPLKRVFDSMDICQSVMANFLVRAAAGQFELDRPEHVIGLLVTMARNKLIDRTRQQKGAQRHPGGKLQEDSQVMHNVAAKDTSPSRVLQGKELMEQIKKHLTQEEAVLVEYRAEGLDWPEIGEKLGVKPDTLRKKFTRALDRIVEVMDVDNWQP